jgi:TfoX/Sxy family transcriptional regulator of competence genes
MAEPYLSDLRAIIKTIDIPGDDSDSFACKHFFSGAAAYIDGHIFMSLSPAGLALKLPEDDCELLFTDGATRLRYFPKAPIKKNYAVLPPELINDTDAFEAWVTRSAKFALDDQNL